MQQVGIIYGDVGVSSFKSLLTAYLEKTDYVQIEHETCGWVLGQIDDIHRQTDLSVDKAADISTGQNIKIEDKVTAIVSVIGYRNERNLLQVPHTPFRAGQPIYKAEEALISGVIGLSGNPKTGAYIGMLKGHNIRVYLDINSMVQKHVGVLAKTGGGKSYLTGVLIEELMKHNVTVLVIDPHGEYSTLKFPAKHIANRRNFQVTPRGYSDKITEFSPDTKLNPAARPLKFTLSNLDTRDIINLTNIKNVRPYLTSLRRALDYLRETKPNYTIEHIIWYLENSEEQFICGALINELEYLKDVNIFADRGTQMSELIKSGRCTIVNLRGTPPDIQELVVNRILTALFELRKLEKVPPMMVVVEEAHNFCPQQGQCASSKILRTIASEGRKFGLGLCIITQRAAKVDKNVLSQCNTLIILKVTNPNDLKAIAASVEGITPGMIDEIQRLPVGVAIVTGGNLSMPLFVEVRPRETKHGGEAISVV